MLLLFALLALGCGEEKEDGDASSTVDAGLDASSGRPSRYDTTLVPVTANDASMFIAVPHEVSLLDDDGNQLVPPVQTTSGPEGQVSLELPAAAVSIYLVGVGPVEDQSSTADTISLNHDWITKDSLLRITTGGADSITAQTAGYTVRTDRAALAGGVYWTNNGLRRGVVACAKVYIDGSLAPDEEQAQRYMGDVPAFFPLAAQPRTSRLGFFLFGNIKLGLHTLRVSLDDGKTFVARATFTVARPRSGARSPTKAVFYQFSLDVEASADPTPADCP